MNALARKLLEIDELSPGEVDCEVIVPAEDWADLVALAKGGVGAKPFDLGLVACSAEKAAKYGPARFLYTGDLFRKALDRAEQVCREVRILSSRHVVLHPDDVLEPYNEALTGKSKADKRAWGQDAAQRLRVLRPSSVLCLAPESYWRWIVETPNVEGLYRLPDFTTPLQGLGIGQQKQHLKRVLEKARAA